MRRRRVSSGLHVCTLFPSSKAGLWAAGREAHIGANADIEQFPLSMLDGCDPSDPDRPYSKKSAIDICDVVKARSPSRRSTPRQELASIPPRSLSFVVAAHGAAVSASSTASHDGHSEPGLYHAAQHCVSYPLPHLYVYASRSSLARRLSSLAAHLCL
jgi:hypothetical protein